MDWPSSLTCQMSFPGTILAPPRPPRTMPSPLGYRLNDGGRSALLLAEETQRRVGVRGAAGRSLITFNQGLHPVQALELIMH